MSEWISVEDRLPDEIFDWILACADGAVSTIGYSKEKGFHCPYPTSTQLIIEEITHWQPLPEPPNDSNGY